MENSQIISSVFKTSGHNARLRLLRVLKDNAKTATDLSELFATSQSYIHRHLQILAEGGLIKKNGRAFTLTTNGKIFVNSLGGMEVMAKFSDFWETHSLSKFTDDIIGEMSVLRNTELITPAPKIISKVMSMVKSSEERVLCITDRFPEITLPLLREIGQKGVDGYGLMGDMPQNHGAINRDIDLLHSINIRTLDVEGIFMGILLIDEKEAGILFPDKRGVLDWNFGIIGDNPDFISWVEKNFWYMYNKGTEF
ncbi:MAG: ArsR family transcriptional regulator [Halobacteriota archaeon]|nr:ArsR family transcriptional regulator [Halobacteriota archaeon]